MEIDYIAEDIELPEFSQEKVLKTIHQIAEVEKVSFGFLNFAFCSDDHLLEINKQYLNHDYYTDIITFQYDDDDQVSSDIIISVDRVKDNACENSVPFINELYRIILHGVLHLSGFKDKTPDEKAVMTSKEDQYLAFLEKQ